MKKALLKVANQIAVPLLAIIMALLVGSIIILVTGGDPLLVGKVILESSVLSLRSFGNTLYYVPILIMTGLGFAIAYRCGLFNIGLEGQLITGAVVAAWVGYSVQGLPAFVHIPLTLLAGALAGGLWAAVPGILKARFGAHEVVVTVMLNYIAFELSGYLVEGLLYDGSGTPQTPRILSTAQLPNLIPGSRSDYGLWVALAAALAIYLFLKYSSRGYEMRAVGLNKGAARTAGINVETNLALAMVISGVLAGLGGAIMTQGYLAKFIHSWPNYGFEGIAVSLLGQNHPLGIVLSSVILGAFKASSFRLQLIAGVSKNIVTILIALVIVFVGAGSRFKLKSIGRKRNPKKAGVSI